MDWYQAWERLILEQFPSCSKERDRVFKKSCYSLISPCKVKKTCSYKKWIIYAKMSGKTNCTKYQIWPKLCLQKLLCFFIRTLLRLTLKGVNSTDGFQALPLADSLNTDFYELWCWLLWLRLRYTYHKKLSVEKIFIFKTLFWSFKKDTSGPY